MLLMANAGVVTATGDDAPRTWRRLVGQMLRSYAVPDARSPRSPRRRRPPTWSPR